MGLAGDRPCALLWGQVNDWPFATVVTPGIRSFCQWAIRSFATMAQLKPNRSKPGASASGNPRRTGYTAFNSIICANMSVTVCSTARYCMPRACLDLELSARQG